MAGNINTLDVVVIPTNLTVAAQNYTVTRAFNVIDMYTQSETAIGGATIQMSNAGTALGAVMAMDTVSNLIRATTVVGAQATFAAAGVLRSVCNGATTTGQTFIHIFPSPGLAG